MKKIWVILSLLILAPLIAEVLSGSTPPLEFINPFMFIVMISSYGCAALLIREAKARWKLQWSFVFLIITMGILIEGTLIQSFFNMGWGDLDKLSGYGMFFGVQWSWTIMLIVFHAIIATLIPITLIDYLFPKYKDKPILNKMGIFFSFLGVILITLFWMIAIGSGQSLDENFVNYTPNYFLVFGTVLAIILLSWLSYRYKDSKISLDKKLHSPFYIGIFAFLFQASNFLIPSIFSNTIIPGGITVLVQLISTGFFIWILGSQLLNKGLTKRHIAAAVIGSLLFFLLFGPIIALIEGVIETLAVSIILLILLILWRKKILKD